MLPGSCMFIELSKRYTMAADHGVTESVIMSVPMTSFESKQVLSAQIEQAHETSFVKIHL